MVKRSPYDVEYFYDPNAYLNILNEQPITVGEGRHVKFDYIEIPFQNGVTLYLFETQSEANNFINHYGFTLKNCPYTGKINECFERTTMSAVKRKPEDIEQICNQYAEGREWMVFYTPFKLDYLPEDFD